MEEEEEAKEKLATKNAGKLCVARACVTQNGVATATSLSLVGLHVSHNSAA